MSRYRMVHSGMRSGQLIEFTADDDPAAVEQGWSMARASSSHVIEIEEVLGTHESRSVCGYLPSERFGGRTPIATCETCRYPLARLSKTEWVDEYDNKARDTLAGGWHEHKPAVLPSAEFDGVPGHVAINLCMVTEDSGALIEAGRRSICRDGCSYEDAVEAINTPTDAVSELLHEAWARTFGPQGSQANAVPEYPVLEFRDVISSEWFEKETADG